MLKFLQFLDHLERQIIAGRTLVEVARTLPQTDADELDSLEEEMDYLDDRLVEIVDEDVTFETVDALEKRSGELYHRLIKVGKDIGV